MPCIFLPQINQLPSAVVPPAIPKPMLLPTTHHRGENKAAKPRLYQASFKARPIDKKNGCERETKPAATVRILSQTSSPENRSSVNRKSWTASRLGLSRRRRRLIGLALGLLLCRGLLGIGLGRVGGTLNLTGVGRRPQGEVVPEELHDKGAVTV